MRDKIYFVMFTLLLVVAILASVTPIFKSAWPILLHSAAGCEKTDLSQLVSPDGGRIAVIRQELCADGAFITVLTNLVQIERPGVASSQEGVVLSLDASTGEDRPHLRWISPTTLEIVIANKSLIGVQRKSYDNVDVAVRYYPDDPVARSEFLKKFWR